jgi:two-component system response regulator HydG
LFAATMAAELGVNPIGGRVTADAQPAGSSPGLTSLVGKPLEEIERLFIGETLKLTGGNREQAAEMLGIGERTLYRKIKEFQLS